MSLGPIALECIQRDLGGLCAPSYRSSINDLWNDRANEGVALKNARRPAAGRPIRKSLPKLERRTWGFSEAYRAGFCYT